MKIFRYLFLICLFLQVYIVNGQSAGTIAIRQGTTTQGSNICPNSNLIVDGVTAGSGLVLSYVWQISTNNGANWENISEIGGTSNGGTSATIPNVQSQVWVRRGAVFLLSTLYSNVVTVSPYKNEITATTGSLTFSTSINTPITIPTISTTHPSTVTIYNSNNVNVAQGATVSFSQVGIYTYTVRAVSTGSLQCTSYATITINVYDLSNCNEITNHINASAQSTGTITLLGIPFGTVSNPPLAIDDDLSTHSTIQIGLSLLGIGSTWQNLLFGETVSANTPVTIKLGQSNTLLNLIGAISIQPLNELGNPVGQSVPVSGSLLDLLTGDDVYDFTFIPKNTSGIPIQYNGVRVIFGSVLALGKSMKIYGANFPKKTTAPTTCTSQDIVVNGSGTAIHLNQSVRDISWGVSKVLGVAGVATNLSPIINPYHAVDNNYDSYATFNKAVSLLSEQNLNVKLRQIARPGDEIRIIMGGFEVPLVDLSLLTAFRVQRYMGDVKVGQPISGTQYKLLDLNLLGLLGTTGNRKAIIVSAINEPFDRLSITYFSTVQVGLLGDYTYIYDVAVVPKISFEGQNPNDPNAVTTLCAADFLRVTKTDLCTNYQISFAYANKDGNGNNIGFTEIPSSALTIAHETNTLVYYKFSKLFTAYPNNLYMRVRTQRQNCPYGDPQYLPVNLINCQKGVVNPVLRIGAKK